MNQREVLTARAATGIVLLMGNFLQGVSRVQRGAKIPDSGKIVITVITNSMDDLIQPDYKILERRTSMFKKWSVLVLVVGLSVGLISCEKLPSGLPKAAFKGPLPFETAKFQDAIPLEYGPLIGLTRSPGEASYWVGLWFEKPDKTIAVVWVNILEGKIGEKITTIPRK